MDPYHKVQLATGIHAGYICLSCLKFPLATSEVKMLIFFFFTVTCCTVYIVLLLEGNILCSRALHMEMGSFLLRDAVPQ